MAEVFVFDADDRLRDSFEVEVEVEQLRPEGPEANVVLPSPFRLEAGDQLFFVGEVDGEHVVRFLWRTAGPQVFEGVVKARIGSHNHPDDPLGLGLDDHGHGRGHVPQRPMPPVPQRRA